jgi:hypothetical protein
VFSGFGSQARMTRRLVLALVTCAWRRSRPALSSTFWTASPFTTTT